MRKPKRGKICPVCGRQLKTQKVSLLREHGPNGAPAFFDNVPARVCQKCGKRWFSLPTVRALEAATQQPPLPVRTIKVPVYSLESR